MTPLIAGLLSYGPSLIRTVGTWFGGKTEHAANAAADLVDQVKGLPVSVAEAKLSAELAKLPPEVVIEIERVRVRLAEIEKEREANRLSAETAQHASTQETARTEAQSEDPYVRRTRPGLARKSAYVTFVYALTTSVLFQAANAIWFLELPGPDGWIIGALFAPCLAYMGVRSVDAFSRKGKA